MRVQILVALTTLALATPARAHDDDGGPGPAGRTVRGPSGKRAKKSRRRPIVTGFAVSAAKFRAEPLERPSGHLKMYAVNTRENLEVDLYGADGQFDPDALDTLNHFWRCTRTGTEKPIDPHLFEILSTVQDHFGGKTLELVSGFRNQPHVSSFHHVGTASDVRMPGVSERALHNYVETLDTGHMGLGIYPRGGFIHVDVRPESYRWTDYSPPGGEAAHRKKLRAKRLRNT